MHKDYALLSDVNQPNGSSQTSSPGGHRTSRRRLSTLQTNSQAKSTSHGAHTISLLFFYFWGKTQDKRGECSGGKLKLLQLQHVELQHVEQLERPSPRLKVHIQPSLKLAYIHVCVYYCVLFGTREVCDFCTVLSFFQNKRK